MLTEYDESPVSVCDDFLKQIYNNVSQVSYFNPSYLKPN